MVKIRLARQGRKKMPIYKIIAANSRARRDGRFIEALGQYRPSNETKKIEINEERIMHWLKVGAQPTPTVRALLSREGILLKWHLEKKQIPAERATEIYNTWIAARDTKHANALSEKDRVKQAKVRALEEKRAADLKEKEAAAKAEADAKAAEVAAEAAAAEAAANPAPAEEAVAADAPAGEEVVA